MSSSPFSTRIDGYRDRVESAMTGFVCARVSPRLSEPLAYAVAAEGKRIRPLLAYATAELLGLSADLADYPAAAIELLHTYSLVHDDLPAMDDDDLRRGQPTVHVRFDEATGILVGDALLTHAFELLATSNAEPALQIAWVGLLARAGGAQGMIAGQATDLEGEKRALSLAELEDMHRRKSGELIRASMAMVAIQADLDVRQTLDLFAHHIGLAFQIRDDILDVEASTEILGKPRGSDESRCKSTFVSLMGLPQAKQRQQEEYTAALAALDRFGESAEGLRWLAGFIVNREY